MNAKPGTIQMQKGRWRIRTARRGFPVRWEPFTATWVVHEILSRSGGFSSSVCALAWRIAGKVTFGLHRQARALARKALEGPASITDTEKVHLADWAQWCSNLDMMSRVKFAK